MSLSDLRDAFRALRHAPIQSLTILFCLTLGSTLTVLMFGVVNAMVAGDIPGIRDRGRLMLVLGERGAGHELHGLAAEDYRALPEQLPGLLAIGAERPARFAANVNGVPTIARGRYVTGRYFEALGTQPRVGRLLERNDDEAGAMPAAVLGSQFAMRTFGDASAALGKPIRVGPGTFTVVGVLPRGFAGLRTPTVGEGPEDRGDIWLPISHGPGPEADFSQLAVVGRLAAGASAKEVEARLQFLAGSGAARPGQDPLVAIRLVPFHLFEANAGWLDRVGGAAALMAVPLIILAIACANVAGVYLSRAVGRTHELAVRISLGASRLQVARLLAFETGLVALVAGAAAWIITAQVLRLSAEMLPLTVTADVRVFLFSLGVPCVVTVLAGLLPAWRATGFDVLAGLRLGPRTGAPTRPLLRSAIVVAQIALSVALLAAAGYLVRAFNAMPGIPGQFHDELLVADVRFLNLDFGDHREALSRSTILERATRISGVTAAATGERLLSQLNGPATRQVTENWFDTVGLRFSSGRVFGAGETGVAVVNEAWAQRLGGAGKAIGSVITVQSGRAVEIVGVVDNSYERIAWGHPVPVAYVPVDQQRGGEFSLYLRGPAASAAGPAVRGILASVDPALAPTEIGTVTEFIAAHYRGQLGLARGIGAMSLIATVLVAVGLFGATSESVARRRHEFGVRLALGATSAQIGAGVLRGTLLTTVTGGLTGLGLAAALLYAVKPRDSKELNLLDPIPAVLAISAIVAIGLAASIGPARRVMRIDPARSLQGER